MGLGWIGSALGAVGSMLGQSSANSAMSSMARENRDWQEHMSNTAHQREVKDLRLAGLNPILSATGGNGATTPTGSISSAQNIASDLPNTINSSRRLDEYEKEQLKIASEAQWSQSELNKVQGDKLFTDMENNKKRLNFDIEQGTLNNYVNRRLMVSQIQNATQLAKAQTGYYANLGAAALINANASASQAETSNNLRRSQTAYQEYENIKQKSIREFYDKDKHPLIGEILPRADATFDSFGRLFK